MSEFIISYLSYSDSDSDKISREEVYISNVPKLRKEVPILSVCESEFRYDIENFLPEFTRESMNIFANYFNSNNFTLSTCYQDSKEQKYKYHCLLIQVTRVCIYFQECKLKLLCLKQIAEYIKYLTFTQHGSRANIEQFLGYKFLLGRSQFIQYCRDNGDYYILSDFIKPNLILKLEAEINTDRDSLGQQGSSKKRLINDFESIDSLVYYCEQYDININKYLICSIEEAKYKLNQCHNLIFDSELMPDKHDTKEELKLKRIRLEFHEKELNHVFKTNMKNITLQNQKNVIHTYLPNQQYSINV